jgi:hypothetical protein
VLQCPYGVFLQFYYHDVITFYLQSTYYILLTTFYLVAPLRRSRPRLLCTSVVLLLGRCSTPLRWKAALRVSAEAATVYMQLRELLVGVAEAPMRARRHVGEGSCAFEVQLPHIQHLTCVTASALSSSGCTPGSWRGDLIPHWSGRFVKLRGSLTGGGVGHSK